MTDGTNAESNNPISRIHDYIKIRPEHGTWTSLAKAVLNVAWFGGILKGVESGLEYLAYNVLPSNAADLLIQFISVEIKNLSG